MAEKKRQHYVPRFYLRFFGVPKQRLGSPSSTIGLFNIPRRLLVPNASIANQCAADWFYGKSDNLEDSFSKLEASWSALLHAMCNDKLVPARGEEEHISLRMFVATQMLRTSRTAEDARESVRLTKRIVESHGRSLPAATQILAGDDDAIDLTLSQSSSVAEAMIDLGVALLVAPEADPLVTSDNPVFRYNLYSEDSRGVGTIGAASEGLLIFLPLSPEICILFYDPSVYKTSPKDRTTINLIPEDVFTLNGLQYVNAEANVYFSRGFTSRYFSRLADSYGKARQEIGMRAVEASQIGDPRHGLIHIYSNTPNLHLGLSFLGIRRRARRLPVGRRINRVRHQDAESPPNFRSGGSVSRFRPLRTLAAKPRSTPPESLESQ